MGKRGPLPKPPGKKTGHTKQQPVTELPSAPARARRPELPARPGGWKPVVEDWWRCAWESPMASQWLETDVKSGLFMIAVLMQDFWSTTETKVHLQLAAEIARQEMRLGLSPADRRRLGWEMEKPKPPAPAPSQPQARGAKLQRPARPRKDPRQALKLV